MTNSTIEKKKILLITGLFFNKQGNQSLYETIKGYAEHFDILFVTSAPQHETYYTLSELHLPVNCEVVNVRDRKLIWVINIYQKLAQNNFLRYILDRGVPIFSLKSETCAIKNNSGGIADLIAYYILNLYLYYNIKCVLHERKFVPDYICAYELQGIWPALRVQSRLIPNAILFSKLQGTVLGSVLHKLNDKDIISEYRVDTWAMTRAKLFDLIIMTNDGTHGKDVLMHYGVPDNKILFLPNGIPKELLNIRNIVRKDYSESETIKLFTISRLTDWKRVHLSILILHTLIKKYGDVRFELNIFGPGSERERENILNLINSLNLNGVVKYGGPLSFDEVVEVYQNNDILISLYKFSNVCNPVFEAYYLGVPIITIRSDALIEIFGDSSNKLILINDDSEEQIVDDIAQILSKITRSSLLSARCAEPNKKLYSWDERINVEVSSIKIYSDS